MICNPFHREQPGFKKLYIFGAGGSAREVAWLAEQAWGRNVIVDLIVDDPRYLVRETNGLQVRLLTDVVPEVSSRFVVAIGDSNLRREKVAFCRNVLREETFIVHPRAELSRWVEIGGGSLICAGVVATTNIRIGQHVHINIDCTISHDVSIGDYSTLSPGVHVSGNVEIGQGVFIGTGASIINGNTASPLIIGNHAVIAAGACVTKTVTVGAMVAGVPAIRKR